MHKRKAQAGGMTKQVEGIPITEGKKLLAVASYCRVSTQDASQETSIENQRLHFTRFIESNPDWILAGIYWEVGVSGTEAEHRPELQRLLSDCKAGHVDMVITKSISRFSRNTADCLTMVRQLTALGVTVVFEKENLRTDEMHSELYLAILAALSQEESRSLSDNMKWAIRKRFCDGTYKGGKAPYGYIKTADSRYLIDPTEAEIVRRIFSDLCNGLSSASIAAKLNSEGIPTWSAKKGRGDVPWSGNRIRQIAKNRFYIGDTLYQKTYRDESYRQRINRGELDFSLKEDAHLPIVDRETYADANARIALNAEKYGLAKAGNKRTNRYCFSGKLYCGECGGKMYRSGSPRISYLCQKHAHGGSCRMKPVSEADIRSSFATLLNKMAVMICRNEGHPLFAGSDEKELQRINAALDENRRRQNVLWDWILAEQHTPSLLKERSALEREAQELVLRRNRISSTFFAKELRQRIERRGILPASEAADDEIFNHLINHAVLYSNEWIEFCFFGGFCQRESLRSP